MGYLQIPAASLANFKKAIISIWFLAPAATLDAVSGLADNPPGSGDGFPPLYKIIPFITVGSLEETLAGASVGGGIPCSPSFVGIDCNLVGTTNYGGHLLTPRLAVNLQTPVTCSFNKAPVAPENEIRPEGYYMGGVGSRGSEGVDFQQLEVTPDVPHHVLISFDITPTCSVTWANANRSPPDEAGAISPGPTFSWAFDDVGMVGPSMGPAGGGPSTPGSTPIADSFIIPQGLLGIAAAGDTFTFPIEDSTDFIITVSNSVISSNGNPVGIPASAAFVDNVHDIVIAQVQMFTGIDADATSEDIRRLFVKADGTPENPSVAAAALGVAPKILMDRPNDFKIGRNTGTIGNFTPTGTITPYATLRLGG